ncbi:MAG TPA: SGNH/GDSL hydrolase family protein [Vicinamibacteria bacterium]|nr:SGNH/GDSL hydrolase family protein [Vicinamibacteria bacterium]
MPRLERTLSTRKRAAFWAVTLAPPVIVAAAVAGAAMKRWPARPGAVDTSATGEAALRESGRVEVSDVRLPSLKGMVGPSVHDDLVYELKPSRAWTFLGTHVRTNAAGFREREFTAHKPPGALRVVGIGDSIMWGWGVEEQDTFLRRLERALAPAIRPPVEVLNLAVPTYNAAQEAAVLERHGMPLAPDLVIVAYTMNDGAPPAFGGMSSPRRFKERADLLGRAAELLPDPADAGLRASESVLRVAAAFERIRGLAQAAGVPVLLFIYPYDAPDLPRRLALQRGFLYADVYPAFEALARARRVADLHALAKELAATPYDLHPGPIAHATVAEVLLPKVVDLLAERHAAGGSRAAPGR